MKEYIKLGWIKLSKFEELTGLSETTIKQRILSPKYPEFRTGAGMVKLLPEGYLINYEIYQEYVNNKPHNYRVA